MTTEPAAPTRPLAAASVNRAGSAFWLLGSALCGFLCVLAAIHFATCTGDFNAGRENGPPVFILFQGDIVWVAAWVIGIVFLAMTAFFARSAARHFARGALVVCLAAAPVTCASRPDPDARYVDGFEIWAGTHISEDAIRKWQATRAPLSASAVLAPAQQPAEIVSLRPDTVTELAMNSGVVLEWGRLAAWGSSRRVFIAPDNTTAPPTADEYVHFLWKMIKPGVYVAVQDRG